MTIRYESVENLISLIKNKEINHHKLLMTFTMQLKKRIQLLNHFLR